MSLQDVLIYRDVPIIGGYSQPAPNRENGRSYTDLAQSLAAVPTAALTSLSGGSGRTTGWKTGVQYFLRLSGLKPGTAYSSNPMSALAAPAPNTPDFPL